MTGSRSLRSTLGSSVRVLGRQFSVAQLAVVSASAFGVALAVPSIWWPTSRLVISDPGRGAVITAQSTWSWGQTLVTNGASFERTFRNMPGLVLFVSSLVIALPAVLRWVWKPDRAGAVLGVLGLTVATVRVLTAVTERLGNTQVQGYDNTGLDVRSYLQPAAVTETMAAAVLALALVGMVALALRSTALTPQPSGIRAAPDGTTPGTGRAPPAGPATGFSDDAPRPEERPDRRFEPPT